MMHAQERVFDICQPAGRDVTKVRQLAMEHIPIKRNFTRRKKMDAESINQSPLYQPEHSAR